MNNITKIILFIYTYFNVNFYLKWRLHNLWDYKDYAMFIIGFILLYLILEGLNHVIRNKYIKAVLWPFLISLFYLAGQYHFRVKTSFDVAIFLDNLDLAFNKESMNVMVDTFKTKDIVITIALFPVFFLLNYFFNIFNVKKKLSYKKGAAFILSYFIILFFIPYSTDDISNVIKDLVFTKHDFEPQGKYELRKKINSKFEERTPNIFILAIESFNTNYVETKSENDKELTPVFNNLIKEGIYVEDYYGNSVQTIKGQFSMYCSYPSLIRGKASYKVDPKKLNCLPKKLREIGYETYFHQGYSVLSFDQTDFFMKGIGFNHTLATDHSLLNESEKKNDIWGWGVQDNHTYEQFFGHVDKISDNYKKPIFAVVHSISNHMKFNIPKRLRKIYPEQSKRTQAYENSIYISDTYVQTFIDELKKRDLYENSIIIITGDHSYPNGEHGFYDSQVSYYQEFFKTPFLLIWKDKLDPKRVTKRSYSHVDIMPTILDLIGKSVNFNGLGKSIFSDKQSIVPLIQPYNGVTLGVVDWPYKFVWEVKPNRYSLYNIEKDPLEKEKIKNPSVQKRLQEQIDVILFSEKELLK